jgi:hypothetical protein
MGAHSRRVEAGSSGASAHGVTRHARAPGSTLLGELASMEPVQGELHGNGCERHTFGQWDY